REARLAELVGDRVAVDPVHGRAAARDRRVDVLGAEERLVAAVAAGFVGQRVGLGIAVAGTDASGRVRAVDRVADEVGLREVARARAALGDLRVAPLEPLRRARAEYARHVAGRIGRVDGERAAAGVRLRRRCREVDPRAAGAGGADTGDRGELGARGARLDHDVLSGGKAGYARDLDVGRAGRGRRGERRRPGVPQDDRGVVL